MLEAKLDGMEENLKQGIELIASQKYDQAIDYFESRLSLDNYLVYYGLATAIFKNKGISLSEEETRKIIDLYKKSLKKNPDFADTYLMCGMAYENLASILTRRYKKDPHGKSLQKIEEIKEKLRIAKDFIQKSVELNPSFEKIAKSEIDRYKQRVQGLDNLRDHYEMNKNSLN